MLVLKLLINIESPIVSGPGNIGCAHLKIDDLFTLKDNSFPKTSVLRGFAQTRQNKSEKLQFCPGQTFHVWTAGYRQHSIYIIFARN